MLNTTSPILIGFLLNSAVAGGVIAGEPESSQSLTPHVTRKSHEWKLESAQLVGTDLLYLAKKETYLDWAPKWYDSDSHWGSKPAEYALLKYSIVREGEKQKPERMLPLGKYEELTHQFTLLPNGTNLLVRLSYTNRVPWRIAYQCWSLNRWSTSIPVSREVLEPSDSRRTLFHLSGLLGAGNDKGLFLLSNSVVCLNFPDLTTNVAFRGTQVVQAYFDSLATNVDVPSKKTAGDLNYFTCTEETSYPVRRQTVIVDLSGRQPIERLAEMHGIPNVVEGELLFLELRFERNAPKGHSFNNAIISRTGQVRAVLELGLADVIWPIGSPVIVFSVGTKDLGRTVGFVVWDFHTGRHWPVNIQIPDQLAK